MARFRFGPLGRLMVVDTPQAGFDAPADLFGGIHESLNGTRTRDVLGFRATYTIELEGLTPRALSWFEMAYRGALGDPLYFVDEQRVNKLSAAVSSALSAYVDTDPFTHLNGTHTQVASTSLLLPGTEDGAAVSTPGPSGAISWTNTSTGNIIRCGPMIPVQPGEHVVFSMYALSVTDTPTLEFTPFDASGAALGQTPAIALNQITAGAPPRYWVPYTVAAGVAALQPCIRHAVAQTTVFTALQLETGDTPTPWVQGGAGAQVVVESNATTRRPLGNMDAKLTLLEA
jgi:hypothetical protein